MSTSKNRAHENASTYFVQGRSKKAELARLQIQDRMITACMGGVLPEQEDLEHIESILDVGCGTGDWLLEVAKTYPHIDRLFGVDISEKMLDVARAQATAQQESGRIQFGVMDALRKLEFPAHSFDLINHRLGSSYIRTWDWPNLLSEYQRVCRPGGVVRVTEGGITTSNSPALMRISDLMVNALYGAGHYFTPDKDGLTSRLADLFRQSGLKHVQTHLYTLEYRAGTPECEHFSAMMRHGFRTLRPFFQKWTPVPEDYEKVCRRALADMQQPGFIAYFPLLTAWGINATFIEE